MKRTAVLAAIAFALVAPPAAMGAAPTLEVREIEVRLFHSHTGTFSEPIPEGAVLWNTIIGEGDAREPSTSTLVKVKVVGAPSKFKERTAVQLTVRTVGQNTQPTILRKSLGLFGKDGGQFVAFWLPNTGCEALLLAASVTGSSSALKHTVPFKCGE